MDYLDDAPTCQTCIHWVPWTLIGDLDDPDAIREDTRPPAAAAAVRPRYGDEIDKVDNPQVWGTCGLIVHPKTADRVRDVPAFTMDSSDYWGRLNCREDFGCLLHDPQPIEARPPKYPGGTTTEEGQPRATPHVQARKVRPAPRIKDPSLQKARPRLPDGLGQGERPRRPESRPPCTEAAVTTLLRDRHANTGNGGAGEWAFMAQVRNAAGFNATRTLDALALHLWPSRGLVLHGFEIKVSRSDWLREVKDPAKAEDACRLVEYFWIVAPKGVVQQRRATAHLGSHRGPRHRAPTTTAGGFAPRPRPLPARRRPEEPRPARPWPRRLHAPLHPRRRPRRPPSLRLRPPDRGGQDRGRTGPPTPRRRRTRRPSVRSSPPGPRQLADPPGGPPGRRPLPTRGRTLRSRPPRRGHRLRRPRRDRRPEPPGRP